MARKTNVGITISAKDKTATALNSVAKNLSTLTSISVAQFMTDIASAAGRALKQMEEFAGEADKVAKAAKRIGISAKSMSQLEHAAKLSGNSVEELRTGMTALTRRASAMPEAFKKWGIEVRNSNGEFKQSDALLNDVADVIQRLPSAAQRAALAQDLMSEAGRKLVPMLAEGAEGLQKFRDEADKLGISISDAEAALSEKFNDSMERTRGVIRGLGRSIFTQLLPAMNGALEVAQVLAVAFREWASSSFTSEDAVVGLKAGLGGLLTVVRTIQKAFLGWQIAVKQFAVEMIEFQRVFFPKEIAQDKWAQLTEKLIQFRTELVKLRTEATNFDSASDAMQAKIFAAVNSGAAVEAGGASAGGGASALGSRGAGGTGKTTSFHLPFGLKEGDRAYTLFDQAAGQASATQKFTQDQIRKDQQAANERLKAQKAAFQVSERERQARERATQAQERAAEQMAGPLASGLTSVITGTQSAGSALMSLATTILQNVLTSGLTSLLKGVGGGPLGFLFSEGGMVPGSGNKDTVPAFLTPGEYVLPKHVVESIRAGQKPGSPGMFNSGGLVSAGAGAHTSINLVMQSASPPNTATLRRDIANGLAPVLDGLTRKRNYRTGARTGGRVT